MLQPDHGARLTSCDHVSPCLPSSGRRMRRPGRRAAGTPGATPPRARCPKPRGLGLGSPRYRPPSGWRRLPQSCTPRGPGRHLPVPGICAILSRLKRARAGTCERGRGALRAGRCPKPPVAFMVLGLLAEASRPSDPTLCGIRRPPGPLSEEAHRSQLAVGS
jgi:hypothetical protein